MNHHPLKKSPEFLAIYQELKKQLEELPPGLIPKLKPGLDPLEQLTLDLLKLKEQKQDIKNLLTPTHTKFLIFAYTQPEFKDIIKNGQLLKVLISPQDELSLRLFAQFRLALDKCFKNKKLTPEQEKLYKKLRENLNELEKIRESKKDKTPFCKSPMFKKTVDPLLEFFQTYFGQDIRQTGTSISTTRTPIQSTQNINEATLDQGPGASPAEEAIEGDPLIKKEKESEKKSTIVPPWIKTTPSGPEGH